MKRILFLFLPFLPYLASAQVAKDTVTVLTLAQIPAGAIRDTTNLTFVQDNGFKKATFDSLAKYTRVKLIGDRGDITVSGSTGLTWELDAGVVDSMQLSAGAVVLPGAKVTGTLPVGKGGTGQSTLASNKVLVGNGTSGVLQPTNLHWDNTNSYLGIGNTSPSNKLSIFESGTNAITIADISGGSSGAAILQLSAGKILSSTSFDIIQNSVGAFLNQRDNNPLAFFVNGFERMRISAGGNVGIGTNDPQAQLHTTGSVRFAGIGTTGTHTYDVRADADGDLFFGTPSDESYKKNIENIKYGIDDIMKLTPVQFNWVGDDSYDVGFIAQDFYNTVPELVYSAPDGKLGIEYEKIVAILTKAIQEQQQQIEQLKQRITQLENK